MFAAAYPDLQRKAVGLAFILGPVLLIAAAASFLLGVALLPGGEGSVIEGVFGVYCAILFIVVFLGLARVLGRSMPRFGITCAITGLLGWACGVTAMADRVRAGGMLAVGIDDATYLAFASTETPAMLAVGIICLLGPLTSVLLGIGFLGSRALPAWTGLVLLVAGICFLGGQATETTFGLQVFYPAATVLWAIALVPIGSRSVFGSKNAVPGATA